MLHEHDLAVSAVIATRENIKEFGTLITPVADGEPYDETRDAHLCLAAPSSTRSIPASPTRFYVMTLGPRDSMRVCKITHHSKVTQVLAAADGLPWFIALAKPGAPLISAAEVTVFKIMPPDALALHVSTWHAGPLFMSTEPRFFYNLEQSDTNVNDRHIRDLHHPHLVPLHVVV